MSAQNELKRLLEKADVTPYRRVGKVRAAHNPRTPADTLAAALDAVRKFAPVLVDAWGEPPGNLVSDWRDRGLSVADVCDDPCPRDVDPATCPVDWLVGRSARYHFRVLAVPPADVRFEGVEGWDLPKVVPLLPSWYVAACRDRRGEIVAHVNSAREAEATDPEPESTRCKVCQAMLFTTDTAMLADPAFCDRGGAKEVRSKTGELIAPAEARCPYKPRPTWGG